jgi:acetylornithine aminotransferase
MTTARVEALREDSEIMEAKAALLAALARHRAGLPRAPQPADPAREASYAEALQRFGALRGRGLFFPYLGSGLGDGPWVELADGSVKLDFITGIGAHPFGHGDPELSACALDAALSDAVMQGNLQQNEDSVAFSARLLEEANARDPGRFAHVFLTTTGAMANENAAKVLFQAKAPASRVLAFSHCFAGRTLGMSWVTDKHDGRVGLPKTLDVDYVPFFVPERAEASTRHALTVLRRHLDRFPGQHALFIAELVQGEGGYFLGQTEFFRALFELCQERGVAVLIDEVQTCGRTHEMFAFQHFGIGDLVDAVTVGKLTQACASIFRAAHNPGPGLLSQTFTGATAAVRVGELVLRRLREGGHFGPGGRNAAIHARFVGHLERLAAARPGWVQGPYGVGAMIGFTPFGGAAKPAGALLQRLYRNGLMGFNAGSQPTRLRFLPPLLVVRDDEIDQAAALIERSMAEVASELGL